MNHRVNTKEPQVPLWEEGTGNLIKWIPESEAQALAAKRQVGHNRSEAQRKIRIDEHRRKMEEMYSK